MIWNYPPQTDKLQMSQDVLERLSRRRDRTRDHVCEIEALEAELKKENVTNNQQRVELEALKQELEKEKAANTLLRSEIEASKLKAAEIEWLRLELKRERAVNDAFSMMIATVHNKP